MKKKDEMLIKIILWSILIFGIIPLLGIAVYNRQSADDFNYTLYTHAALINGGGIIDVIRQAGYTVAYYMENWNGLFFSTFLQSLSFSIFGSKFAVWNTVIIMLGLCLGVGILCWTICRKVFKNNSSQWKLMSAIIIVYILQTMPSPVQGLYWYNGAINYMFLWSLFLVWSSCTILYLNRADKRISASYITGLLLTILTVGGNHIVQGLTLGFSLLASLWSIYRKKKRGVIIYFLISMTGFVINMVSGGTESRWESFEYDHSIVSTVIHSASDTVQYSIQWFTFSLLLVVAAVLILCKPLIAECVCKQIFSIKKVFVLSMLSVAVIFGMMFIPTYAMGYSGSGRVTNIIYAMYVLLVLLNIFAYVSLLLQHMISHGMKNHIREIINYISSMNMVKYIFLVFVAGYITLFGMGTCIRVPYGSTAVNALKDIVSGDARTYAEELDAREAYYAQHQGEDIEVEPLSSYPYTLYFTDVETDAKDYKNKYSAEYYGVKSIVLKDTTSNS